MSMLEQAQRLSEGLYVMTHPGRVPPETLVLIHDLWKIEMGDKAKLLILQEGMTLTAVAPPAAMDLLRRLVEDSDAGCDTYEIREIVEEARSLLGLSPRHRGI